MLHRGFAWVWGLVLALTMFTLSYPDCVRAADEPLTLSATEHMTEFDETAVGPRGDVNAASCPHPGGLAVSGDALGDLPDFDLAPVPLQPPGPQVRHAWVAAPAVGGPTTMVWLALRPPNA